MSILFTVLCIYLLYLTCLTLSADIKFLQGEKSLSKQCIVYDAVTGQEREYKLFIAVNLKYFEVLLNWLTYYYSICRDLSKLYILCLDSGTSGIFFKT